MSETPESIVAVAIRDGGLTWTLPSPARHHDVIARLVELSVQPPISGTQGFVTSTDRFVERKEAATLAFAAGQIKVPKSTLFSEDLW